MICRQSVATAGPGFQERFEGCTRYPYVDVKNLLTIATGCLIDPVSEEVLSLPWSDEYGNPLDDSGRVIRELTNLKSAGLAGRLAGYQSQFTTIRLTMTGVNDLVEKRMGLADAFLGRRFPWYATAPADAQMGLLSMAWAMGPAFQFPKFEDLAGRGIWASFRTDPGKPRVLIGGAANECRISTVGNPGVAPRNTANLQLFENAQAVVTNGWDLEQLFWPTVLS